MKLRSLITSLFLVAGVCVFAPAQDRPQRPGADPTGSDPTGSDPAGSDPVAPKPVALDHGAAKLNPTNTTIQFTGTHAGDEPNPRVGHFQRFSGTASVESETLQAITVEIEAGSLTTRIPDLTNHLKSPDFFDAREYPTAKFESTQIAAGGDDEYRVTGNLTLLGTTQEISFPATVAIGEEGITLRGNMMLDRTMFGMDKLTQRVNKEVELAVTIGQAATTGPGGGARRERRRAQRGGGRGGPFGDPEQFFTGMDADGDGKLSGDELPERMAERLDRFDTDADGAISRDEFLERMKQFRERGGERGDRPNRPQRPRRPE
jgi:polyisoprenoid-binding protein YceI